MNDKDFDALFQRAAEKHRIPYNPKGWNRMRRKLDRAGGNNLPGKIVGGVVLILLLGGLAGLYQRWGNPEPPPVSGEYSVPLSKRSDSETASQGADAGKADDLSPENNATADRRVPDSQAAVRSDERDNLRAASRTDTVGKNTSPTLAGVTEIYLSGLDRLTEVSYLAGNAIQETELETNTGVITEVAIPDRKIAAPPDTASVITDKKSWEPVRLRVSLGVSPDVSAIDLGDATQVGTKASFGLEFFIFPRLSVLTGVIISSKLYTADGESYKPYPGYWMKYPPAPSSIDAHCDVLDIPLNVRYYGLVMPRSRFFVSGGVSSYLMLTEDYVYHYKKYGSNQRPDYEHHERNENQHYFKVANISLGYERALSKRWALQVEPFVKIPVAGVGFGKIKLSTTGVFMSLNYQLR